VRYPLLFKLSVSQLAFWGSTTAQSAPKICHGEIIRLAYVVGRGCFCLFPLLALIANHIATPFDLTSAFPTSSSGCRLLMRGGSPLRIQPFSIYHGGVYHRLRHFPTGRRHRWAVYDALVGSGNNWLRIQAYGRWISHGVDSVSDGTPMRKMP
jgi:hypothetical protein